MYQKEEKEAAMLVKKQKSYTLIDADDDDDDVGGQVPHVVKSHKLDIRQKRFRKKSENEEIDDEEAWYYILVDKIHLLFHMVSLHFLFPPMSPYFCFDWMLYCRWPDEIKKDKFEHAPLK